VTSSVSMLEAAILVK